MARPLRLKYSGALYHIASRGNERKKIFRDDEDRELFLRALALVVKKHKWTCHAYCLMDNHYHLLIETPEPNLSEGMGQLNGIYTQKFNRARKRVGHLFQGRFKSVLVQKESHLLEVARYIVLNPVRAKIVDDPSKWRWSSYSATGGFKKAPEFLSTEWLLGQFGKTRRTAARGYREFVRNGIGSETIWKGVKAKSVLGEAGFVAMIGELMAGERELCNIPRFQRHIARRSLEELAGEADLDDKEARGRFIKSAVKDNGYSQSTVARFLGLHQSTVCKLLGGEDDQ